MIDSEYDAPLFDIPRSCASARSALALLLVAIAVVMSAFGVLPGCAVAAGAAAGGAVGYVAGH